MYKAPSDKVPALRIMGRLGQPIWRRIEPLGKRLLPVQTRWQALLFGMVWGWLPCGMVYYVLVLTLSAGTLSDGALYMLSYGAGTLPATLGVGMVAGWFIRLARNARLRQGVGLLVVFFGLASLVAGPGMS
jgi:hypothetical protein